MASFDGFSPRGSHPQPHSYRQQFDPNRYGADGSPRGRQSEPRQTSSRHPQSPSLDGSFRQRPSHSGSDPQSDRAFSFGRGGGYNDPPPSYTPNEDICLTSQERAIEYTERLALPPPSGWRGDGRDDESGSFRELGVSPYRRRVSFDHEGAPPSQRRAVSHRRRPRSYAYRDDEDYDDYKDRRNSRRQHFDHPDHGYLFEQERQRFTVRPRSMSRNQSRRQRYYEDDYSDDEYYYPPTHEQCACGRQRRLDSYPETSRQLQRGGGDWDRDQRNEGKQKPECESPHRRDTRIHMLTLLFLAAVDIIQTLEKHFGELPGPVRNGLMIAKPLASKIAMSTAKKWVWHMMKKKVEFLKSDD
jgi:hypothetical protein